MRAHLCVVLLGVLVTAGLGACGSGATSFHLASTSLPRRIYTYQPGPVNVSVSVGYGGADATNCALTRFCPGIATSRAPTDAHVPTCALSDPLPRRVTRSSTACALRGREAAVAKLLPAAIRIMDARVDRLGVTTPSIATTGQSLIDVQLPDPVPSADPARKAEYLRTALGAMTPEERWQVLATISQMSHGFPSFTPANVIGYLRDVTAGAVTEATNGRSR